jgi:hypothetical protein
VYVRGNPDLPSWAVRPSGLAQDHGKIAATETEPLFDSAGDSDARIAAGNAPLPAEDP